MQKQYPKTFGKNISQITLGLLLVAMASSAFAETAAVRCQAVLIKPELSRGLDTGYAERYLTDKNTNKIVEAPNQIPIMDQGQRGFCFLYSWTEQAAHDFKMRNNGEDPHLSISYLAYYHWLDSAVETATNAKAALSIPEGGTFEHVVDLARERGLMTEDQWAQWGGKPTVNLSVNDFIEMGQLKSVVATAHIEKILLLKILEPKIPAKKTFADYFTSLVNDTKTDSLLKEFVLKKQKQLLAQKTHFDKKQVQFLVDFSKGKVQTANLSENEKKNLIFRLNQDIGDDVHREFNAIFFGQEKNPLDSIDLQPQKDLALKVIPDLNKKTVTLMTSGERQIRTSWAGQEMDHYYLNTSLPEILKTLKARVDMGLATYIAYDHQSYFVDSKTGAMTIEGFTSNPLKSYIDRASRSFVRAGWEGHATQIVGYELDAKGEIVALKMQNSWSAKYGKLGYFRMDMSFFRAFVSCITFQDKEDLYTDKYLMDLKKVNK